MLLLLPACGDDSQISVFSHGVERWATVDRPTRPASGRRPLLVVLHAALFSGALARGELKLSDVARRAGVALAFLDTLIAALVADGTADPVVRWTGEVTLGGVAVLQQRMSVPASFAF